MSRLREHLEHIRDEVVPSRGAAQSGLSKGYIVEIEARPQPPHLLRGLEQWNAGRFYEQHETLEWLWRATTDPVRDAIKGIIQSGVGAYHVEKRNRRGALAKWTGAVGYLEPFHGLFPYGINTGHLRKRILEVRQRLLEDDQGEPDWETHLSRVRALHVDWNASPAEPEVTSWLRRLDRAWQESPQSVEAAMKGLTAREADWTLETSGPSIRALLTDAGQRKWRLAAECFGEGEMQGAITAAPGDWRRFTRWLTDAQEAVREPLGFLEDAQLAEERSFDGRVLILGELLEEQIERDFVVAGQIQLLRSLYALSQGTEQRL